MAGAAAGGTAEQEPRRAALAADPERRHDYLLRQAMFTSLERELEIA